MQRKYKITFSIVNGQGGFPLDTCAVYCVIVDKLFALAVWVCKLIIKIISNSYWDISAVLFMNGYLKCFSKSYGFIGVYLFTNEKFLLASSMFCSYK